MFEYAEKGNEMFLEKVQYQHKELEAARKRNEELKNKLKVLEEENRGLKQTFDGNQLQIMTGKNELNNLIGQLNKEKRLHMEVEQRLRIFNEQIEMLTTKEKELNSLTLTSMNTPPPTPEQLSFKQSVEDCLRDMLVQTKLRQAEEEEVILDLTKQLRDLEDDVDEIKRNDNGSVGKWQQEFLEAKLREAELILEFGKIKRELADMKEALDEQKQITGLQSSNEDNFSIIFNMKNKQHEKIRSHEEISLVNTLEYQNEIDNLKRNIRKFVILKEDLARKIQSNKELKENLYVVRGSIYFRERGKQQEIEKWQERSRKLEQKFKNNLLHYEMESDRKDNLFDELIDKIDKLKVKINEISEANESITENRVKALEGKQDELEEKISSLKDRKKLQEETKP